MRRTTVEFFSTYFMTHNCIPSYLVTFSFFLTTSSTAPVFQSGIFIPRLNNGKTGSDEAEDYLIDDLNLLSLPSLAIYQNGRTIYTCTIIGNDINIDTYFKSIIFPLDAPKLMKKTLYLYGITSYLGPSVILFVIE